jgi:hypothetical protein
MVFADLPAGCPPHDGESCVGEIYRLVSSPSVSITDFVSHFDKYPGRPWPDECQARGLSVCLTYAAADKLRKRIKALAGYKIAVASLQNPIGIIKQTGPSMDHHTWWPEDGVSIPGLFNLHDAESL